jgi:PKD repeat protein
MISAHSSSQPACSSRSFARAVTLVLITLLVAAGNVLAAPKPNITSPTTASGTIGFAFSYQITANQSITTWGAAPLPAGLTVNPATGLISGTPSAAGTFSVDLSATNANGTGTATLTLTISGPPVGLFVGLRLPDFLTPAGSPNKPRLMLQMGANGTSTTTNRFNATLEVDAGGGTWVPYNRFVGIDDLASWITDAPLPVRDSGALTGAPQAFSTAQLTQPQPPGPGVYMKADPRATRFGIFQMDTNPTGNSRIIDSLWPLNSSTFLPNGYGGAVLDPGGPVEHAPLRFAGNNYFPATLCINNAASTSTRTGYADSDGIIRPADATYPDPSVATTGSSTPYNTLDYRPIILNRPFQNVAELGYVFRDLPWKTLDLFTDKSADAGLLDVFTINDGPARFNSGGAFVGMGPVPAMVAGRINLNTRQTPVLQSVLAGANWDLAPTIVNNTGTPTAQIAPTMATNIATATSATLMKNKTELITRAGLPTTILPTASQANQTVKARREVVPRAISSVSQTRVWNVVIDVVAQSGKYKPNAQSLTNDFIVEGEQHYWVHVAIDRFSGQVIDKLIEVVNE